MSINDLHPNNGGKLDVRATDVAIGEKNDDFKTSPLATVPGPMGSQILRVI